MEHTIWKEEYRIGVKKLDDDHIAICGLLERLLKAIYDKEGKSAIVAIFSELHAKLNEHFHYEKHYLLEAGYPKKERKEHIDEHLDVLYKLDHGFLNWEKSPESPAHSEELSNLCRSVWIELINADMEVKKKLEELEKQARSDDT